MKRMRTWLAVGAVLLGGGWGAACAAPDDMPELEERPLIGADDSLPAPDGEIPATVPEEALRSWSVHFEELPSDTGAFRIVDLERGLGITTGPAGLAWRPADLVDSGDFHVSARFTVPEEPGGGAAPWGLFVGGLHLDSPDHRHLSFLVRGSGEYRIERREGDDAAVLVDWTPLPAAVGGGAAAHRLAVEVRGELVRFLVDDAPVESLPADDAEPWGFAGLRVGEGQDLRVDDWTVEPGGAVARSQG